MSVSSYGHAINTGSLDLFDYGLPSLRESSEDMSSISILMDINDTLLLSWRIDPDDVWKVMLPVSISKHRCPSSNMDNNLSLVDTVIEIPICQFHHKLRPSVFTTAVSVPIVGMTLALVRAPLRCRTQGTVQTVEWKLGMSSQRSVC